MKKLAVSATLLSSTLFGAHHVSMSTEGLRETQEDSSRNHRIVGVGYHWIVPEGYNYDVIAKMGDFGYNKNVLVLSNSHYYKFPLSEAGTIYPLATLRYTNKEITSSYYDYVQRHMRVAAGVGYNHKVYSWLHLGVEAKGFTDIYNRWERSYSGYTKYYEGVNKAAKSGFEVTFPITLQASETLSFQATPHWHTTPNGSWSSKGLEVRSVVGF